MKFSQKKILITGGAGFIGFSLARKFLDLNSHVIVIDNFSLGPKENIPNGCEVIKGDVTEWKVFQKIHDVDFIVHLGSPSSVVLFNRNPNKCIIETIIGGRNVFEYAKQHGVKKVLFPSSSSVYGNAPLPQSETTPATPTNLYGVTKLTCEHIARLYSDTVPSVVFRIFAGYGPREAHKGEVASVVTLFWNAIESNSRPLVFGDGTQSRDFVFIDDITEAAVRSLESNFTGIVNIGSGKSSTFNELVKLINDLLGKNIHPHYIDKPSQYFEHTRADIKKMKKVLELFPISLEEGLKKYAEARAINHIRSSKEEKKQMLFQSNFSPRRPIEGSETKKVTNG